MDRGVGLFGRLGVSDGDPNFMKFFGSFGVGGKGLFDSRPQDQFGLAITSSTSPIPHSGSPLPVTRNVIFTRRVWLRGLLQFCNHAVGYVDARHTDRQRRSERQNQPGQVPWECCPASIERASAQAPPSVCGCRWCSKEVSRDECRVAREAETRNHIRLHGVRFQVSDTEWNSGMMQPMSFHFITPTPQCSNLSRGGVFD